MPGESATFLAKRDRVTGRGLSLVDHSLDVAACHEALLTRTLLGRRLAALAGAAELHPSQVARLTALAALHDFGKVNHGFQRKIRGEAKRGGHEQPALDLLQDRTGPEHRRLLAALDGERLATWFADEPSAWSYLCALLSHHGRPKGGRATADRGLWRRADTAPHRDPLAGVADLVEHTRAWLPGAWDEVGATLPAAAAFVHAWAGLLSLADWIGSDERIFPLARQPEDDPLAAARRRARTALRELGLDPAPPRALLPPDLDPFRRISPHPEPRGAQRTLVDLQLPRGGSVTVLEAETGAGKTEAALVWYLRLFHAGEVDGLYFALPTRTAATQIYERVVQGIERCFPAAERRPPVVQAVPGYLRVDGREGHALPDFEVRWGDEEELELRLRGWAGERAKRFLAGAVVVGTVDQVLLSTLAVPHAHLRSAALLRHLLVVDEVHASDPYMTRVLESVLDQHRASGGHALLMSATLGSAARQRLLAADRRHLRPPDPERARTTAYPLATLAAAPGAVATHRVPPSGDAKRVATDFLAAAADPRWAARAALRAAEGGARVLVVRNLVSDCQELQRALEEEARARDREALLFRCQDVPAPHHSRFAPDDRRALDRAIEAAFSGQRAAGGVVAVATQTVQQSLDLDADLLFTDLCPMDVMLQRIGRLHRHHREDRPAGFGEARVVVLVPENRDLGHWLGERGKGRGPHGLGPVYPDLRALEATWREIADRACLEIPAQNRELVEAATHPLLLARITEELGEPWGAHETWLDGQLRAERKVARFGLLRRDLPFADPAVRFDERRPPTRLGADDRMVRFPEPPPGPFGRPVAEMGIPGWMLGDGEPEVDRSGEIVAGEVEAAGGEVRFVVGGRSFVYDRRGLTRILNQ